MCLGAESLLVLDRYGVAAVFPLCPLVMDQLGVEHEPLGMVEFGRDPGPSVVFGLEPAGPFAGVLAGQQPGQPGGAEVGVFAALGQGLFTGSGLVSVVFYPVYFGVRWAHKGRLSSNREPEYDGGGMPSRGAANGAWTGGFVLFGAVLGNEVHCRGVGREPVHGQEPHREPADEAGRVQPFGGSHGRHEAWDTAVRIIPGLRWVPLFSGDRCTQTC